MTNQTFTNGYALLIGVGADLLVTVKDATALRDILIDSDRAAYPPKQVTLLTETSATRQNILAAFDQIITQVNQNSDATVIIYYSGHGGRIQRTNKYFLLPFGYNPSQRADTAISGVEFTQKIEAITARKLVVLLDCCHASGVPALKEPGETFVKFTLTAGTVKCARSRKRSSCGCFLTRRRIFLHRSTLQCFYRLLVGSFAR